MPRRSHSAVSVAWLAAMIFAVSAIGVGVPTRAFALTLPERPTTRINDYSGTLSASDRAQLESQLAGYEQGQTTQIAVAIFKSLDGEDLEDTSIHLAEKWKIGSKKNDDGVLLTVFLDDHKLRIEVGYGLEGKLTDLRSSQIIREQITPRFRAGDIAGGLRAGLAAIDTELTGRPHTDVAAPLAAPNLPGKRHAPGPPPKPGDLLRGIPVLIVVLIIFFLLRRGRRSWWSGGSGGWISGGGFGGGGGFSGGGGSFGGGGSSGSW